MNIERFENIIDDIYCIVVSTRINLQGCMSRFPTIESFRRFGKHWQSSATGELFTLIDLLKILGQYQTPMKNTPTIVIRFVREDHIECSLDELMRKIDVA